MTRPCSFLGMTLEVTPESWGELPANKHTGNQLQALRTLDDKTHYYRKDGWLKGEKRMALKKLLVHINDYLKFQHLLRTNKTWTYFRLMSIKHEYSFAEEYLFSDWEFVRPLDCRYACNIAGIKYEYLVDWLRNISLGEIESILKKIHF